MVNVVTIKTKQKTQINKENNQTLKLNSSAEKIFEPEKKFRTALKVQQLQTRRKNKETIQQSNNIWSLDGNFNKLARLNVKTILPSSGQHSMLWWVQRK